ncbi:MAG TPA: VWA domain-containing protein [Pyrinomonadaceae bacterium]|nr:VWA domain-containing protein [Pyrinomonadaceae bacterium]
MKQTVALLTFLLLLCVAPARAQNPPSQTRPQPDDDRVVVTTNLVQVDAVVTDKNGKQINNLRPTDFELIEGGRTRDIVGFSYIDLKTNAATSGKYPVANARNEASPPQLHALRPESVRRAIAIVVDDFGLSFESIARLRGALEKFVSEQTESSDVIAVVRASGGPGSMQQFTSNRAQVIATVKRLRWYQTGRGGAAALDSMLAAERDDVGLDLQGYSSSHPPDLSHKEFFGGSLGALGFVIDRLARFPGRKSIVFISENLPLTSRDAQAGGATRALDRLIELANQHSIVISTMDARGLPKSGMTADDNQFNLAANQVDKRTRERFQRFTASKDALNYIAERTGGMFVQDQGDLNNGLRRIINSEQGYYLLAFRPDDADKERPDRTYRVTVRLKQPDLVLRSRSTFRKFSHRPEEPAEQTKTDVLRDALASPFVKENVRLKVTALFTGRLQIKVLVHVDARDITFTESPDGSHKASFDLAVVAFDDNGKIARELLRSEPLTVPAKQYEQALRDGLAYTIGVPLQKAGPYQVRVAVRDDDSGRLGSDSQFVEVPEARPSRLSVAGLIMQANTTENRGGPSVRRFVQGDALEYSYLVYGARQNQNNSTALTSQIRLFRGSEEVLTGKIVPTTPANDAPGEAIIAGGRLAVTSSLPPGEYFLQVTVTDELAPRDKQTSTQWIDFEIIK